MSFSLFDLGTQQQLGEYPHEEDALVAFRAMVPPDAPHNLELRPTEAVEPVAKTLGLSLLAYGAHPALLAQLRTLLRHEVDLEAAMGWVDQVVARPQSNIDPASVKRQWEEHRRRFRTLVENFAAQPQRTNANTVNQIEELGKERARILDLARRLDRDATAPAPVGLDDLNEKLRSLRF